MSGGADSTLLSGVAISPRLATFSGPLSCLNPPFVIAAVLPRHPPAGCTSADMWRSGGPLTLIYTAIIVVMINIMF